MISRLSKVALATILLCTGVRSGFSEPPPLKLKPGKSEIIEAIDELRNKSIFQAYFALYSPQLPHSILFAPDTKGGVYVILTKDADLPGDLPIDELAGEINNAFAQFDISIGRQPTLDRTARKLVYISNSEWSKLLKLTKSYQVENEEVSVILQANGISRSTQLFLRIPIGKEHEVLDALFGSMDITPDTLMSHVGWN